MGKVSNMATEAETKELSEDILGLKESLNLPFNALNKLLGEHCRTTTLQIRARYPGKPLSKKLFIKLNNSISDLKEKQNQKLTKVEHLENIKSEAIKEITKIIDDMLAKL